VGCTLAIREPIAIEMLHGSNNDAGRNVGTVTLDAEGPGIGVVVPAIGMVSLGQAASRYPWSSPPRRSNSLDSVATVELLDRQLGNWLFEVDAAMGTFLVVMGHQLAQDALGMALAANKHPVQALEPGCEHKPFGKSIGFWRSERCIYNFGAHRSDRFVEGAD
jgi:hypothetical protein